MNIELSFEKLNEIKAIFGDGFYVLDSLQFRQNFEELRAAFVSIYPNFNIAYSYKTNYTPKLCMIVKEQNGIAEVVSEMELELATRIGVRFERIIWNGPIKNPIVVEEFLLNGGVVNLDSIEELATIKSIVLRNPHKKIQLGVRCNFDVNEGFISRFGFDINSKEFYEAISFIQKSDSVEFNSLQCHFSKRQLDYWPSRVEGMLKLIDRISCIPKAIDLGGGLFGKMEESLKTQFKTSIPNFSDYAAVVATKFLNKFGTNGPMLIIEPGTALVGDCMKYVGSIKSIKCIRGKYFASVLGSQKNINMAGVNPPIKIVGSGIESKNYEDIDFVGYTCIEGDTLYKGYKGRVSVGDFAVFSNCGSYSLVMKPPFILPNFPVLDLSSGNIEVVKRAETFDDVFKTYCY
jgi:diaminopimelate decarboxylase